MRNVNVMEGINFKDNRKRILEEDKKRYKKAKRNDIKADIEFILIAVLLIGVLTMALAKFDEKELNKCVAAGHTVEFCKTGR